MYVFRGLYWIFFIFLFVLLGVCDLWSLEDDWIVFIFKDIFVVLLWWEEVDFKVVFIIFDGFEVVNLFVEELLVGFVVCVRDFFFFDLFELVVIFGKFFLLGCIDIVFCCLYLIVNVLFRLKKVVVFIVCFGFFVVGVSMFMVVFGLFVFVVIVVVEGGGKVVDKIN